MTETLGNNAYIKFGSTVLSGDYRTFGDKKSVDIVDASAGADTFKVKLAAIKDASASIEILEQDGGTATTGGTATYNALDVGTSGTLEWGPEGTTSTKPKYTATAIVKTFDRTTKYNDIRIIKVDFEFTGAVTAAAY